MRPNPMLALRAELPAGETSTGSSAIVLPFELDLSALDPGAASGLAFLLAALDHHFVAPAMQTRSSEEFHELWEGVQTRAVRLVQAVSTLVHEAASGLASDSIVRTQLVQADRRAVDALASRAEQNEEASVAARIRDCNMLISRARAGVDERGVWNPEAPLDFLLGYRHGNLTWAVGMNLFKEVDQSWLPGTGPRPDLIDDCLALVESSARAVGICALLICDVEFQGEDSAWWSELLEDIAVFNFLLEAQRRVRSYFGNSTTITIKHFIDPEGIDVDVAHFCIETDLPPERACDQFESFCEDWWHAAVDEIAVTMDPVLDVAR